MDRSHHRSRRLLDGQPLRMSAPDSSTVVTSTVVMAATTDLRHHTEIDAWTGPGCSQSLPRTHAVTVGVRHQLKQPISAGPFRGYLVYYGRRGFTDEERGLVSRPLGTDPATRGGSASAPVPGADYPRGQGHLQKHDQEPAHPEATP
jgi:hypothetical protein